MLAKRFDPACDAAEIADAHLHDPEGARPIGRVGEAVDTIAIDANELSLSYTDQKGAGVRMTIERATRQRAAITAAIRDAKRPLSPGEVLEQARASVKGVGLATVYRTLKLLIADGSIQAVNLPGESPRYESAESGHHHHFRCNTCRRVYDIAGCPGDLRRLAPRGFRIERHDVTLYGRCSDCGKSAAAAR